jgi:photosystem II stability/assembly factor-like uncharacterized protein
MRKYLMFLAPIIVFTTFSCKENSQKNTVNKIISGKINRHSIPGSPSLRGVNLINGKVAWISGSKGTFARSIDAGKSWEFGKISNDTLLDFRDIQGFSENSAMAISAGSPAKIYKTNNGGTNWELKYENTNPNIFFDSFDFYDCKNGVAYSDPINGKFFIIKTSDGGETWDTICPNSIPIPLQNEAGFAASGTSVLYCSSGTIMLGTGGDKARIVKSNDHGQTWEAIITPLQAGSASLGIYSIGKIDAKTFMITGGNWQNPNDAIDNTAISFDFGKSWTLTQSMPSGFRSVIKFLPKSHAVITSGTNGTDISFNLGQSWQKTSIEGFNALDVSPCEKFIVFVGSEGRIGWISK